MTGSELLSTPDAQVWAKEFCEKFGGNTVNGGVVDLELMFGWFANAMEAGRMQVPSATPSPTIAADDAEAADSDSVEYANKVQSNLSRPLESQAVRIASLEARLERVRALCERWESWAFEAAKERVTASAAQDVRAHAQALRMALEGTQQC